MARRVEIILLLMLLLSLCYFRVGSHGSLFVNELQGSCGVVEREALLSFKRSLFHAEQFLYNWDIANDCCTWTGVICSNKTGHVIELYVGYASRSYIYHGGDIYATSLVSSLFRLKHLQSLSLSGIYFNHTSIPHSIDSLTNLRFLDLSYSGFAGEIPLHLGNLTNLRSLYLCGNSLVASNLLWISQLFSLQYLDMSDINLKLATNWLYEISVLPALLSFRLSSCNIQTLPTLLTYSNFSSTITDIDLSYNNLNGSLPNWLGQFKILNSLYLQSNSLTGPIPWGTLSLLCNLEILNLSENKFTKLIDDRSALRCKEYKMTEIYFSSNQLNGTIPEWVGQMRHLTMLDLGNNQLTGSIPQSFGQLTNLNILKLYSNLLIGNMSDVNFANLSQLFLLDLSDNRLNFNKWIPPFQVSRLVLSSCITGPNFPNWLQNIKSLSVLDLSNSGISDIIPSWFWNISSQMWYLNMSHNTIRGELPLFLNLPFGQMIDLKSNLLKGHLPQLSNSSYKSASFSNNLFSSGVDLYLHVLLILDLSQNYLSGEIPDSICQMPLIFILDLSYNNLSGEIPKCKGNISSFMSLRFLSLTNNNFWGSIPQWMGNLPLLLSLYLNNNNFQKEMPFFKNSSKLITLDIGQNKLTGSIPIWIGERLASLKVLCLRSNKFHGLIPSQLFKLKGLQILDLADNCFSGPLPKSLKFLTGMTIRNKRLEPLIHNDHIMYGFIGNITSPESLQIVIKGLYLKFTSTLSLVMSMDLSCNNLTGEVPSELMSLIGLISLNLSRNQFTGQIPINIGVMQSLESLDLSRNHFSGEIPMSIGNLSGLEYLNLSYNQLSGRIPMGTQLDTFQESSYYGNPELCGKPLIKTCEGDEDNIHTRENNSNVVDNDNFDLFLSMGLGFVVGLCSMLGTLFFKRSLAIAYFQLCDNITNNIYVFVIVKVNRWFNR